MTSLQKPLFILGAILCLTGLLPALGVEIGFVVSPPIALAMGLLIGLTVGHPYPKLNKKWTKVLLQWSVVGLGFGTNLQTVFEASRDGVFFTIATIVGTLLLGWMVGKWLKLSMRTSHLISSGTAICGGSAIAAVGPVLEANEEEMSVALGTIFILNSIALFVFPAVGHALAMTQQQFGIWAAIAIHDTSSVVGAATSYGAEALAIATTVKLARALWIIPLVLLTAFLFKRKDSKVTIPWFIFFFLLASVARTYVPTVTGLSDATVATVANFIVALAKTGLTLTLFLIGAGLSRSTLKSVGPRPLVHGVILWIVISLVALWAVRGLV